MSEAKKILDLSQFGSIKDLLGVRGTFAAAEAAKVPRTPAPAAPRTRPPAVSSLAAEGAAGASSFPGGEGMMAFAMEAPEIVAAVIAGCILFFFAGGVYLNYWISAEYDKFAKVWRSDESDGWGWYHFWHALMDLSFLTWFWEIWFGPRAQAQTGGVSRYRCTNGLGEPCGDDHICQNLDRLGSAMDNLGLWLGWWEPAWDHNYRCEEGGCDPGFHSDEGVTTHCVKNECTCLEATSNKGQYTWKTGDETGEICLVHEGHGCKENTCNDSSFYSHRNCFPSMECGCPASDFNDKLIINRPGSNAECISTDTTGEGLVRGSICIAGDGSTIDQATAEGCRGAGGTWYAHTGCGTCNQPNPMTVDQRNQCVAESNPSTTKCHDHGSNCIYTANPGETATCTVSDSGNIFSRNQGTGLCEEKRCTCVSDTGTYTEQRGIPNTGDACPGNGRNSCQSCYDGFVSDPTHIGGENECLLPITEQTSGSFCWESEGILCADTYFCGNTQTLNFADGAKGMCLPKHQENNLFPASPGKIHDMDCNIEPSSNPYKPGQGHESSGDGVTPVYATLQLYMDSLRGCSHSERVATSMNGLSAADASLPATEGANTCTDGRECLSGLCGSTNILGTWNCYQGPNIGAVGSCCDPVFEVDYGGYGSDHEGAWTDKYYGTSAGDHPGAAVQRNRVMNNLWWIQHGETINRAMSGRA
jgi:hypothetical protein